uniref:ShKT domain-containing protein n=1 Tax=Meloidogyne floridensis TaxID=298350 RepID=A0A915NU41_9BILA
MMEEHLYLIVSCFQQQKICQWNTSPNFNPETTKTISTTQITSTTVASTVSHCTDNYKQCKFWSSRGLCQHVNYSDWTKAMLCPESCVSTSTEEQLLNLIENGNEENKNKEESTTSTTITYSTITKENKEGNPENEIPIKWGEVDDENEYKKRLDETSNPEEKEKSENSQDSENIEEENTATTTSFLYSTMTNKGIEEVPLNEIPIKWGEVDYEDEYKNKLDEKSGNKNSQGKYKTTLSYYSTKENEEEEPVELEVKENNEETTTPLLIKENKELLNKQKKKEENLKELKELIKLKTKSVKKLNEEIEKMEELKNKNKKTKILDKIEEEENSLEEIRELQREDIKIDNLIKNDERIKKEHLNELKRIVEQKRRIVNKLIEEIEEIENKKKQR